MLKLHDFMVPGKASLILGGQWGSEGKGAAAAFVAATLMEHGRTFDIITTNAGAQAGHTSLYNGKKRVAYHLPTAALIVNDGASKLRRSQPVVYLNAGSIIDPVVLQHEIDDSGLDPDRIFIHPNAAVITPECKEAEARNDSAQTKIASTRKGVGEALSRKVLRSGLIARDYEPFKPMIRRMDLSTYMHKAKQSVLIEVPQGASLSVNGKFWPNCTSRDCTVGQALNDAGIHPSFIGPTMLVLRTFPIRVGNIVEGGKQLGHSGGVYPDQVEITWDKIGVQAEITTVTGRVRRVFTFSRQQLIDSLTMARPTHVHVTFCDYLNGDDAEKLSRMIAAAANYLTLSPPQLTYQYGPSTDDARFLLDPSRSKQYAAGWVA